MHRTNPRRPLWAIVAAIVLAPNGPRPAGAAAPENEYLSLVRARAAALRAGDSPPDSLRDWEARRPGLRRRLGRALALPPDTSAPLDVQAVGTLERDGYRVEKVVFTTLPPLRMTANVYAPATQGRHPAVLCVHGHWRGAKQDPVVQARCIGLAKLGFVVLVVDALGAGERGVGKSLGEYHGEMTAATLFPAGHTLAGLQVYENTRALAYLRSRPDVDPGHVGVTGASGGGNQTTNAAAMIDGLHAAAPVCSVGNYQAYLGAACCMCEVVPGALTFTEEWGTLGLFAPRPLMIVNATRDAVQFSVAEAKKTVAGLQPLYAMADATPNLKHAVFESGHDYSKPMREAVYGWFTRALMGRGDGAPVAEPAMKTEDPEALRCFPGTSRPDDFVTIPRFAASEGRRVLTSRKTAADAEGRKTRVAALVKTLGGFPDVPPVAPEANGSGAVTFAPEPGLTLSARVRPGKEKNAPRAIVLDLDGGEKAEAGPVAAALRGAGWGVVTLDLRATGRLAWPSDKVGRAPDHNTAEWGLWIGRPLLGQWVFDVRRLIDALEKSDGGAGRPSSLALVGVGPGGLVALAAAATDPRVTSVATVGMLASYVSDVPYQGQRLGVIAPGILRDVGDVADLAALIAPRRVVVAGGVSGGGKSLGRDDLRAAYAPAARAWEQAGAAGDLAVLETTSVDEVVKALR